MTALTEPFPPWLRDLNRFFNSDGTASAFVPPADVLVDDDGVTVPGVGSDHLDVESRTTCSPSAASGRTHTAKTAAAPAGASSGASVASSGACACRAASTTTPSRHR